jgi:hypothetical protein
LYKNVSKNVFVKSLMICTPLMIKSIEMGGEFSAYVGEERRGVYRVLVEKHAGKRPLGRPKRL